MGQEVKELLFSTRKCTAHSGDESVLCLLLLFFSLGCGCLRSQGFIPCGISLAAETFFPVKFPSSDGFAINKDISAPVVISRPALGLLPQNTT